MIQCQYVTLHDHVPLLEIWNAYKIGGLVSIQGLKVTWLGSTLVSKMSMLDLNFLSKSYHAVWLQSHSTNIRWMKNNKMNINIPKLEFFFGQIRAVNYAPPMTWLVVRYLFFSWVGAVDRYLCSTLQHLFVGRWNEAIIFIFLVVGYLSTILQNSSL